VLVRLVVAERELGPDRRLALAVRGQADSPPKGEPVDDAKAATADRGVAGLADRRPGRAAAVAHGELEAVVVEPPGDADDGTGQRRSVPEGITDKFTKNETGITRRSLEDSSLGEVAY
jgi:hypothetical protein